MPVRSQLSVVQVLLSLQPPPVPAHLPPVHTSLAVQGLPSSQLAPFAMVAKAHRPVPRSHVSLVQGLPSVQATAPPVHTPSLQASELVHATPSLHALPSLSGV